MVSGSFVPCRIFDASRRLRNLEDETASTTNAMALRELSSTFFRLSKRDVRPSMTSMTSNCRRYASSEASSEASSTQEISQDLQELESISSYSPSDIPTESIKAYDPVKRAQGRRRQLPPSRFVNWTRYTSDTANTMFQLPVSTSKILQRTSPSSSTSSTIRSFLSTFRSWAILPHPSRANLPIDHSTRSHGHDLRPHAARDRESPKVRSITLVGRFIAIS